MTKSTIKNASSLEIRAVGCGPLLMTAKCYCLRTNHNAPQWTRDREDVCYGNAGN